MTINDDGDDEDDTDGGLCGGGNVVDDVCFAETNGDRDDSDED